MKKKIIMLLLSICIAFNCAGCGEDKELTEYKEKMDTFFSQVENIHNKINALDPESEDALEDLFDCLDELDTRFQEMAKINVPDEFSSLENLADEASENMSLAVENYHNAYSSDSYNEFTAATAHEYYARANKRIQYMIDILHGEMPDGDDVIITTDEE